MAKKQNDGFQIGQLCPVCKQHHHRRPGRLYAITSSPLLTINELECRKCHRRFEAQAKGMTLSEYREQDLTTFKNPAELPRLCPCCNRRSVIFGPPNLDPNAWMKVKEPRTEYLYCMICQRICWLIPTPSSKT